MIKPGDRFGKLSVIKLLENRRILCRCDCGNQTTVIGNNLTSGHTKSCGCTHRQAAPIQPGTRFGKLTVIQDLGKRLVSCQCDCGNTTVVQRYNLLYGRTQSCGCGQGPGRKTVPVGSRFGKLTVIQDLGKGMVLCQCDCGNTTSVTKHRLLNELIKSCGCSRKLEPIQEGTRFGRLTVLMGEGRQIKCQCDCGAIKNVSRYNLIRGNTKSCGCLRSIKSTIDHT